MKSILRFSLFLSMTALTMTACNDSNIQQAQSDSGVKKASVAVKTDANGHTAEQVNYMERVTRDNEMGSVKHLYIISSYTGDVLEYSTVRGKVTSGGKRLSPKTVNGNGYQTNGASNYVTIAGQDYTTNELPDEYGTYGDSSPYFYWFDAQGNYHQYYPSGGTFVHISDRPLRIKKANFSVEIVESKQKSGTTEKVVNPKPKDTSSTD
jgi:hypothetical protein